MEEYRLNLGRGDLRGVKYPELQELVDRVLVVDIVEGDPNTHGRIVFGEKLVGLLLRNNPPTLFGVRFKEDARGEHLVCGEKYKRLNYTPEELVLSSEDFALRNARAVFDGDKDYQTSYMLKGIIDGL